MPLILKELAEELLDLLNVSLVGPLAFLHRLFEFLDVFGAAVLARTPSLNHHLLVLLRFMEFQKQHVLVRCWRPPQSVQLFSSSN